MTPDLSGACEAVAVVLPPVYAVLPFVLLLLAIAVLPLTAPHFWEHNRNKALVAGIVSLPILGYYLANDIPRLLVTLEDYVGFIVLLWSLYTISGGIVLRGNLTASPGVNTAFLAVGAVLANVFGTTGASMLLIRPMLRTNQDRAHKVHTFVFFIFIVSNIAGSLTPLGDPPLYMGFLKGIPFTWTLGLWPEWLLMNVLLLGLYYAWDRRAFAREAPEAKARDLADNEPVGLDGWLNVALIVGVLATIVVSGQVGLNGFVRDAIMIGLGLASLVLTPKANHQANAFTFNAIIEVAVLFLGIFITMVPALVLLQYRGQELGVTQPWQYFWAAGGLSSFLDNTPTYLTFLALAQGSLGATQAIDLLKTADGVAILRAISLGAVFMGANTYIGNGPNFMVKAIAEEKGPTRVQMPSFGGYMLYSFAILIPLFLVVSVVFFVVPGLGAPPPSSGGATMDVRPVLSATHSVATMEGAGVRLNRAFGNDDPTLSDPFLLLDDFRSDRPADYQAGFPWHPHRGMETITYVLAGDVEHGDSLGNQGVIGAGDVQWMSAGSGIIHQEMPQGDAQGRMQGFQLWANLPAALKMSAPKYRDVRAADIPEVVVPGGARVKVIAGTVEGVTGPVGDVAIAPEYLDVSIPAGGSLVHPVPRGHSVFAYVFQGRCAFGAAGAGDATPLHGNLTLVRFGDGDVVEARAGADPVRFLLVSGKPLREPIAWGGPIVMNTQEELQLAFREYRDGTFLKHAKPAL
jgi:redox-sensitive bicupin YhaK (pirin superfamily)/Na+/H+ antiporter NhaD/arsenite permease-like protein